MVTDRILANKLILIQEESPCSETDKAIKRRFVRLIRISEIGVMNFADKVEDFSEAYFSKSVCKITELKSRIEYESQDHTLMHDQNFLEGEQGW